MIDKLPPNFCALIYMLCFATASVIFGHFARRVSAIWMNTLKAVTGFLAFGIAALLARQNFSWLPHFSSFSAFFLSGFFALGLGDILLLQAYASIGAARTLMIFSFQPVFIGAFAYLLFAQALSIQKSIAILFMIACVFTVSYERFHAEKKWEIRGPLYALAGVLLDATGILLTRYAFDQDPRLSVFEGSFYRCCGALAGLFIASQFRPIKLWSTFFNLKSSAKTAVLAASFIGVFVSLTFYLSAIGRGNLATVSAIAGSSPVCAALLEALMTRKWPSRFLYIAFLFFLVGFYLLNR